RRRRTRRTSSRAKPTDVFGWRRVLVRALHGRGNRRLDAPRNDVNRWDTPGNDGGCVSSVECVATRAVRPVGRPCPGRVRSPRARDGDTFHQLVFNENLIGASGQRALQAFPEKRLVKRHTFASRSTGHAFALCPYAAETIRNPSP